MYEECYACEGCGKLWRPWELFNEGIQYPLYGETRIEEDRKHWKKTHINCQILRIGQKCHNCFKTSQGPLPEFVKKRSEIREELNLLLDKYKLEHISLELSYIFNEKGLGTLEHLFLKVNASARKAKL